MRLIANWIHIKKPAAKVSNPRSRLLITFYFSNSRSSISSESDSVEFIDVATGSISATNYSDFDQSKYNYKLPFQIVNVIAISSTNLYHDKNSVRYNTFWILLNWTLATYHLLHISNSFMIFQLAICTIPLLTRSAFLLRGKRLISIHFALTYSPHDQLGRAVNPISQSWLDLYSKMAPRPSVLWAVVLQ